MTSVNMDNLNRLTTNSEHFPAFRDIPGDHEFNDRYYIELGDSGATYKKRWCLIGEITQADAFPRPRLVVRDRTGTSFVVALYLDRSVNATRILSKFKKGYTVAIMTALGHYFLDGSAGCRIEDEEDITVSARGSLPDAFLLKEPRQVHDAMCQT